MHPELSEFIELLKEADNDIMMIDSNSLDIINEGDWVHDYKYQSRSTVVKYKNIFIKVNDTRSGSYHTDWEYFDPIVMQVEPVIKVVETTEYKLVGRTYEVK